MAYPNSSDVAAGQPTASAHYNNLRKDAVYLGNAAADSLSIGSFLARFVQNLSIIYLATNRLRVPLNSSIKPAMLVINGYLLKATADIDLPAGMFSGAAMTWYIFAVRSAGSTTFTLTVNTSSVEGTDQRLIGECYWDGAAIGAILCYFSNTGFPDADYDSGWFSVVANTTYTKAHGLSGFPRVVELYHATDAAGTSEWVRVTVNMPISGNYDLSVIGWTSGNIIASSTNGGGATCQSSRRSSAVGYWRILAWL
jgi:hypothetical protein